MGSGIFAVFFRDNKNFINKPFKIGVFEEVLENYNDKLYIGKMGIVFVRYCLSIMLTSQCSYRDPSDDNL